MIIDEAHERSVGSDILIGLLSRVVRMRRCKRADPLKLVIMSATLRTADFQQPHLFTIPPTVLNVEARQFPVSIYFDRRTRDDYVAAAFAKAVKVHRALPPGAMLVFVTGQREVHQLVRMLQRRFTNHSTADEVVESDRRRKRKKKEPMKEKTEEESKQIRLDDYMEDNPMKAESPKFDGQITDGIDADELGQDLCVSDDDEVDEAVEPCLGGPDAADQPLHVLPLYSLMPMHEQCRVFAPPPANHRLCVVCTNVAETSLTIPGVKYVIDTGRCKTRVRDAVTGVSRFVVAWTSKAAAEQRAGRAGRTQPGVCYRLYSSAIYNDQFPAQTPADIANTPVDELLLHMHAMNIVHARRFPFITPPSTEALATAERRLQLLGAVSRGATKEDDEQQPLRITPLGRTLALLPVAPAYGKVLVLAEQHAHLLPYAVALVAALSVREPFVPIRVDSGRPFFSCHLTSTSTFAARQPCVNKSQSACDDTRCTACMARRRIVAQMAQRKVWLRRDEECRRLGDLATMLCAYLQAEADGVTPDACERLGVRCDLLNAPFINVFAHLQTHGHVGDSTTTSSADQRVVQSVRARWWSGTISGK